MLIGEKSFVIVEESISIGIKTVLDTKVHKYQSKYYNL